MKSRAIDIKTQELKKPSVLKIWFALVLVLFSIQQTAMAAKTGEAFASCKNINLRQARMMFEAEANWTVQALATRSVHGGQLGGAIENVPFNVDTILMRADMSNNPWESMRSGIVANKTVRDVDAEIDRTGARNSQGNSVFVSTSDKFYVVDGIYGTTFNRKNETHIFLLDGSRPRWAPESQSGLAVDDYGIGTQQGYQHQFAVPYYIPPEHFIGFITKKRTRIGINRFTRGAFRN